MAGHGRPMKGKSRRIPLTVNAPLALVDAIDEYVAERDAMEDGSYSRSDFYTEAAIAFLQAKGKSYADEEVHLRRCKTVAENDAEKEDGENREKHREAGGEKEPM